MKMLRTQMNERVTTTYIGVLPINLCKGKSAKGISRSEFDGANMAASTTPRDPNKGSADTELDDPISPTPIGGGFPIDDEAGPAKGNSDTPIGPPK
jgi:hypothetical protein